MQRSTSCSHCHDNHRARATMMDIFARSHQNSSRPASGLLTALTSDLNPVDYRVWDCLQDQVYQKRVCDIDELKQRLVEVWSHFSQAIIDEAIDEWKKQLLACVRMNRHHLNI